MKYPVDAWRTYLNWQMINFAAPWLSDPFVQARFEYRQSLTGQKELQARWKRCVDQTDNSLGEALGQSYVDQTFGVEGKQRMLKMVNALEQSLDRDIATLPWMTDATKKEAKIKLDAIRNKIGYPEKWRDYSSIKITRDDFLGDYTRAAQFEAHRQANKIGKPVDKTEWDMTPPTVNAYYSGQFNEIVFPAGILQPPFFEKTMDDAVNFGGIGAVIGHELTHGFDDQGRKFAPNGNMQDWWTEEDAKEFEKRASCIADEYSAFTVAGGVPLNGRPTLPTPSRVVVENVRPEIDAGRFPVKRTIGEPVEVTADVFADGHDVLAAVLRHRPARAASWSETRMEPLGNDRWAASFTVTLL